MAQYLTTLFTAWDQVNSTLAAMGHKKTNDATPSQPVEVPSVAPPDASTTEPPKHVESVPCVHAAGPVNGVDPLKPDPDVTLPANLAPAAETHTETPIVDMPAATPTPPKPVLKFKPPKAKPKPDAPVAPAANGDANTELEALLSPDTESKAAPAKGAVAVADADLLLGELVDEIGVDIKPRGTPSWSSKRKGKDRADGPPRRLVPESASPQGSPAAPAPAISPVKPLPKKASSSNAPKARDPMADAHPIDTKRCNDIIRNLTDVNTLPEVGWFLLPVDPIASGCPT